MKWRMENFVHWKRHIKNNRSWTKMTTHAANGEIINNGVRLRKSPSTSAIILELMQNGEIINVSVQKDTGSNYSKEITEDAVQYQELLSGAGIFKG